MLLFLLEQLIRVYSDSAATSPAEELSAEIKIICEYMESHYAENMTLNQLKELSGLGKFRLLRLFTKEKGISPYRYLETIRINQAKRLLEQGVLPVEVAFKTGFSDQSHFTNFFKKLIGLTPKQYRSIFKPSEAKTALEILG